MKVLFAQRKSIMMLAWSAVAISATLLQGVTSQEFGPVEIGVTMVKEEPQGANASSTGAADDSQLFVVEDVDGVDEVQEEPQELSATDGIQLFVVEGMDAVEETVHEPSNLTEVQLEALTCTSPIRPFNAYNHDKRIFRVGVRSLRGSNKTQKEYNQLFSEYLTKTAGNRFDPPISFEMVPLTFEELMNATEHKEIDFIFANPSIFSCIGTEFGAIALATVHSRVKVRGRVYELDVYGGVMFTKYDRNDINTITDVKDKIIGRGTSGDLAGGQAQFSEMVQAGMSYVLDPKQVIYADSQSDVVTGVIDGSMDIGFVRTDQIERSIDESAGRLNINMFKIIDPKTYILENGEMFPFLHSTEIFPEWPFASLTNVPEEVQEEVQSALLALETHAAAGRTLEECVEEEGKTVAQCNSVVDAARCDTTMDIAITALNSTRLSKKGGFRPPRSYFGTFTMQDAARIINKDGNGKWQCRRSSTLYEGIGCPAGYMKISEEDFQTSCAEQDLPCKEGTQCFCRPCTHEVNVYEYLEDTEDTKMAECAKGQLCASVEQDTPLVFRAYDRMERSSVNVRAVISIGISVIELPVTKVNGTADEVNGTETETYTYEFSFEYPNVASGTISVYFDDVRLPSSPFQIHVVPKDCDAHFPGQKRSPSDEGVCVCRDGSMEISGTCFETGILFALIATFVIIAVIIGAFFYTTHKRNLSDQVWLVNPEELHFDEIPEVIGQGSFGVVLAAEYRGTKVAIKSVLPGKKQGSAKGGGANSKVSRGSRGICSDNTGAISCEMHSDDGDTASAASHAGDAKQVDLEAQAKSSAQGKSSLRASGALSGTLSFNESGVNLGKLGKISFGAKQSVWAKWCPGVFQDQNLRFKSEILANSSGGTSRSRGVVAALCPCLHKQNRQKQEFILEMRLLSRLRHPCITTVMGAVISPFHDPMLVMEYMEYGSLFDLLQNETMYTGGDIILQIVRDISQGLRYLHSSKPPILHGDLKARNILIDSRFRAKVADFGLSSKKKNSLTGTPYFMAPEYLCGKSGYTTACDIYSVGIILFEMYAREDPYEGDGHLMKVLHDVCNPRINKRPYVPETMPPKMVDIMKKCWAADPFFRPQAKDLDVLLMDMNMQEAEPQTRDQQLLNNGKKAGEMRSADMLYEVFPRHIADALKAGRKVEPETHEMVTVFFSDIVGFTDMSRQMSPSKVCDMLGRLYESFDKLARGHKVFKVETIGDAYMGVTNLDGQQEDCHVKNIAEFAIEAQRAANQILKDKDDPSQGYIHIRCGFHSGPVVSNVIGSMNPRYGLFGDTVNTASRMESNSKKGRVHCSEKSALILMEQAPELTVKRRGKLEIKGKGQMTTYWVAKPRSAAKELEDDSARLAVGELDVSASVHVEFAEDA